LKNQLQHGSSASDLSVLGSAVTLVRANSHEITIRAAVRLCGGRAIPLRANGVQAARLEVRSSKIVELFADRIVYEIECISDKPVGHLSGAGSQYEDQRNVA
jgi:hypothetical protein